MAPLPGTPAASLPPPGGATPNLVAAVLLVVVAGSLIAPDPWSRRRRLLVAVGGISIVLLGLVAASFSTTDISGATGATDAVARVLTVAGVLVALPMVVKPQSAPGRWQRAQSSWPRRSWWCWPSSSLPRSGGRWRPCGSSGWWWRWVSTPCSSGSRELPPSGSILRLWPCAFACSIAASVTSVIAARP